MRAELGLAQLKQGQTAEAIASLRQAMALDPSQINAKLNLANALAMQGADGGGLDEALALLLQALEEQPRSASILLNLGNVLRRMEKPAEAEAALRQAVAIEPLRGDTWNNLLGLLQGVGRLDDAERTGVSWLCGRRCIGCHGRAGARGKADSACVIPLLAIRRASWPS